jgi:hypothetical protein
MKKNNQAMLLASLLAVSCADSAYAVSIARPDPNKIDAAGATVKEFIERASHEFNLYVAHSCAYIPYGMATTEILGLLPSAKTTDFDFLSETFDPATHATTITLDTSTKIEDVFWTEYTDPNDPTKKIQKASGPLLNLRVRTNEVFKKTKMFWQQVDDFGHHGRPQTDTVSAAHWHDGKLSDQLYTDLKFRATTARLKGCVAKVKVYVPVWQICGATDYTSFSAHPNKKGANDFAPNFTIVRNEITNPYPPECSGTKTTNTGQPPAPTRLSLVITPSAKYIDKYLKATKLPGKRTAHSFSHGH